MEKFFINQTNNAQIIIGGVKLLKEFSPEQITVSVVGGQVNVDGQGLKIAWFDENEMEITGKIENVETNCSWKRKV